MVNCIVTYFLIADVLRSVRGPLGRVLQTTLILLSKAWKSVIHLWKIRHLYGLTRICFLVALPARLLVIGFRRSRTQYHPSSIERYCGCNGTWLSNIKDTLDTTIHYMKSSAKVSRRTNVLVGKTSFKRKPHLCKKETQF